MSEPRQRILVVEDSEFIQAYLGQVVDSLGFEVEPARSGAEALGKIDSVDLVLLDIVMPGMDGIEVAHRIRSDSRNPGVPIIIVSGSTEEAYRQMAEDVGVDDFVSKPIRPIELKSRIDRLTRNGARRLEEGMLAGLESGHGFLMGAA